MLVKKLKLTFPSSISVSKLKKYPKKIVEKQLLLEKGVLSSRFKRNKLSQNFECLKRALD